MTRATLFLLALLGCGAGAGNEIFSPPPPPPPGTPSADVRLLFVGNSLTYSYNIPSLVVQMATQAGLPAPAKQSIAEPNYALEDHWNVGAARSALATGHYTTVIFQQGPSTLVESGADLTFWLSRWADEARKYGTRPAAYVVWPPRGGDLDAGIANYTTAANVAGAAIYPVGQAWREAWRIDADLPLYGPDQFHPSQHGAWLAALVICAMVFDRPVADFPNVFPALITEDQERALRQAATTAIAQYGRR